MYLMPQIRLVLTHTTPRRAVDSFISTLPKLTEKDLIALNEIGKSRSLARVKPSLNAHR